MRNFTPKLAASRLLFPVTAVLILVFDAAMLLSSHETLSFTEISKLVLLLLFFVCSGFVSRRIQYFYIPIYVAFCMTVTIDRLALASLTVYILAAWWIAQGQTLLGTIAVLIAEGAYMTKTEYKIEHLSFALLSLTTVLFIGLAIAWYQKRTIAG